jgi:hypothetical protein
VIIQRKNRSFSRISASDKTKLVQFVIDKANYGSVFTIFWLCSKKVIHRKKQMFPFVVVVVVVNDVEGYSFCFSYTATFFPTFYKQNKYT